MCQNGLAGSPPVQSGQSWLSTDTPGLLYQPLSQAGAERRKAACLLCWGAPLSRWMSRAACTSKQAPQAASVLCVEADVLWNQGSTLIFIYLGKVIKIKSRPCSEEAKSRASVPLIFILVLQPLIFLDDFSASCILLCTDLSKVASWLLQSSISQSILLLFWVPLPFQVGYVYDNKHHH